MSTGSRKPVSTRPKLPPNSRPSCLISFSSPATSSPATSTPTRTPATSTARRYRAVVSAADGTRAWKLPFIDFKMMGEVPKGLRQGLRKLVIAAASRDGMGMVDGVCEVGVLLPSAATIELERAVTKVFTRFGGMGFAELQEIDPREFDAFAGVRRSGAIAAFPAPGKLPSHRARDVADLRNVQFAQSHC